VTVPNLTVMQNTKTSDIVKAVTDFQLSGIQIQNIMQI